MSQQEEKFRFPGIVPYCIEYTKTKEEITEDYFQATKGEYATDKVGTLYPFSLSFQNMVKFYWRMKKINFSVNLSNTYKYTDEDDNCVPSSTETHTIVNNEGKLNIEPSDPLDSLKQRACNLYTVSYQIKSVYDHSNGTTENIWDDNLSLNDTSNSMIPPIVAECEGDPSNPSDYIYYPHVDFYFSLYSDSWGSYLGYDSADESVQNQKTVNVKLGGQTVSSFVMYMVSRSNHNICEIVRNSTDFSDWDIELWEKPQ